MKSVAKLVMLGAAVLLADCASHPAVKQHTGVTTATTEGDNTTVVIADPANDQTSKQQMDKILQALEMIQAGQARQAIDGPLSAVVDYFEKTHHDPDTLYYSARSMGQALMYSVLEAAKDDQGKGSGKNAVVLGAAWGMAHWAKGYAYSAMGQYKQARVELGKALALSPMNSQYTSELAYTWLKARDWNKALGLYRTAADDAELVEDAKSKVRFKCVALRGQGYALVELHRLDEATKAYQGCLKINPDDPKSKGELRYISRQREKKNMP